jgi:hypothetical protein
MSVLRAVGGFFGGAVKLFTGGGFTGLVASLLMGAALGGWGAWQVQSWRYAELARQQAEQKAKAIKEARADETVRIKNAERINDEQDQRAQRTAARLAVSERAAAGLRDEVQRLNARPVPEGAESAALAGEARAARDLLGRCAEAYRRVDGRAQALGDQVSGLQDFVVTTCKAGQGGAP